MIELSKISKQRAINYIELEQRRRKELRLKYAIDHHLNTHGKKLTFDDRPYLIKIYKEWEPNIVVKKSVQCGASEWAICDCFAQAERGLSVIYVLPKYTLRNRFVKRIDKVIDRVPYYRENIGDTDSLWHKRYCGSDIIFASSETSSDFIEFPADVVIVDEIDKCNQVNIALAPDRLTASEYKYQRKISTPTIEDYGIDLEYKKSDTKEWHITCEACGERQPLDFFTNVIKEVSEKQFELIDTEWTENSERDIQVYCRKCKKPIDRLAQGEWVAKHPDRHIKGYHINQLMASNVLISELWDAYLEGMGNHTLTQIFFNSRLGLAHTAEGDRLSNILLNTCIGDHMIPSKIEDENIKTYMGIDVGKSLHIIIGTKEKVLFIGMRQSFEECSELIERFNVEKCVVDNRPETRKAVEFQKAHKDIVWLCEYIDNNQTRLKTLVLDRKIKQVQANRTQSLDESVSKIVNKRIQLPKDAPGVSRFYDQMIASVRVIEEKSSGRAEAIWTKADDHYFHTFNYYEIAQKIFTPTYVSY